MAVACERLAHRTPNPVVGVLVETLQHPHDFPSIENRGSIAKHMYSAATNRSIGVGDHLQNAPPDFSDFGFQFAWAERLKCFAALPRVGTASVFKPVRDIALASSHDQPVALSRSRPYHRSRRSTAQSLEAEYRVWSSGGRLGPRPLPASVAFERQGGETPSVSLVKQTAKPLRESLARILLVWFDRGYL